MKLIQGALLAILILVLGLSALSCKKKSNPMAPGGGADVTIDIIADMNAGAFGGKRTVAVGKTVAWRNTRGTTHTATSTGGPGAGQWNTQNISPGTTSSPILMNTTGTYPYECLIHTSMKDTLVVQ
jgi:plastocyanin